MYAIIRTGGKQYRVRAGDRIAVEHLAVDEGTELTLEDVLAVGDDDSTTIGAPTVAGASITARVEAHGLGRKVTSFRFKNKTRTGRRRGHRQQQTELVITGINAP
jgi:large subunit ribosomal protein L21